MLAFLLRGKVVDLVGMGVEDGGVGKERMVSSRVVRDSVGEGGRGMFVVCGVRLSQGIVSRRLAGEEGGVNSKVGRCSCS